MSQVSFFFADFKTQDKEEFLKKNYAEKIQFKEYESWLRCISVLRNMIAHFSRLYFHSFNLVPRFSPKRNIKTTRKLIDTLEVIKILFPNIFSWDEHCIIPLEQSIAKFEKSVNLSFIGFDSNWKEQLSKTINPQQS